MTGTSGREPAIADVLTAINGLQVNGPEPVRALRENVLTLGNRTQRLIDGPRGDADQRFGPLMDAIADLRAGLEAHSRAIGDAQDRSSPSHRPACLDRLDMAIRRAPIGAHDRLASPGRPAAHRSARAGAGAVCGKFGSAFAAGAIHRSSGRREPAAPGDKARTPS